MGAHLPPLTQPLLTVQGSPGPPNGPGIPPRRPGSHQPSPAKELAAAVQHGDVEGALRAASWACLRSPVLLAAICVLLMGTAGLAAFLLPQQPLPGVLHRVALRQAKPRQRSFFEELEREERQLFVLQPPASKPPGRHRKRQLPSREQMLDALILSQGRTGGGQGQQQQQQQQQQDAAQGELLQTARPDSQQRQDALQPQNTAWDGDLNSSEIFNIHEIAKVPPLFGGGNQQQQ